MTPHPPPHPHPVPVPVPCPHPVHRPHTRPRHHPRRSCERAPLQNAEHARPGVEDMQVGVQASLMPVSAWGGRGAAPWRRLLASLARLPGFMLLPTQPPAPRRCLPPHVPAVACSSCSSLSLRDRPLVCLEFPAGSIRLLAARTTECRARECTHVRPQRPAERREGGRGNLYSSYGITVGRCAPDPDAGEKIHKIRATASDRRESQPRSQLRDTSARAAGAEVGAKPTTNPKKEKKTPSRSPPR